MIRRPPRSTLFPYTSSSDLTARRFESGPSGPRHFSFRRFSLPSQWDRHRIVLRSEEHTSELQSRLHLVCRLLLEKKKNLMRTLPTVRATTNYDDREFSRQ